MPYISKITLPNGEIYDIKNTTYANATTVADGLLSATDKIKLDNLSTATFGLDYVIDGPNESVIANNVENNIASGQYSKAEGNKTVATGKAATVKGNRTFANEDNAEASGLFSNAKGENSSAKGINSIVTGMAGTAEGMNTIAAGLASHTQGTGTIATETSQTVIGQYNLLNSNDSSGDYAFVIGNGSKNIITEEQNGEQVQIGQFIRRSNAMTVDWNGNVNITGSYYVNGIPITTGDGSSSVSIANVTLDPTNWSNNTQTVTVAGVTTDNTILVTYAPTSKTNYINAGIYCTAQGDGTLTFVCVNIPTTEISVNVIIYINTTLSNANGVSF